MHILVSIKTLVELESHAKDKISCKDIWGTRISVLPVGQINAKPKTLFCFIQCSDHHTLSTAVQFYLLCVNVPYTLCLFCSGLVLQRWEENKSSQPLEGSWGDSSQLGGSGKESRFVASNLLPTTWHCNVLCTGDGGIASMWHPPSPCENCSWLYVCIHISGN